MDHTSHDNSVYEERAQNLKTYGRFNSQIIMRLLASNKLKWVLNKDNLHIRILL